jgi:hypothetical protein|tara:strand:- start:209 stop:589 length:381 start_codon:yes stop_codon:yes gene_type:complete
MSAKTKNEERRHYHRVGFHGSAMLSSGDVTTSVEILDICLAGALLKLSSEVQYMNQFVLKVTLSDEVSFEMSGSLESRDDGSTALHRDLNQLENDYYLRRLLELNLGDPELVERDVKTLIEKANWT